jgi:hypothetical protein
MLRPQEPNEGLRRFAANLNYNATDTLALVKKFFSMTKCIDGARGSTKIHDNTMNGDVIVSSADGVDTVGCTILDLTCFNNV